LNPRAVPRRSSVRPAVRPAMPRTRCYRWPECLPQGRTQVRDRHLQVPRVLGQPPYFVERCDINGSVCRRPRWRCRRSRGGSTGAGRAG
jgi:hypothetical protein